MRILVLTDRYPPWIAGGYEVACRNVVDALRANGHDVRVLTSQYGLAAPRIDGHSARVLHRPQDCSSLLQLAWAEVSDHRVLASTVRRWRPDVIYVWSTNQLFPSLHVILKRLAVPTVLNIQDSWLGSHVRESERLVALWQKTDRSWAKRSARAAIARVLGVPHRAIDKTDLATDEIVFCSRFRQLQHVELGMPVGANCVIGNAIDLARFSPRAADVDGVRALFVGRLVHEKGAHVAVASMQRLIAEGEAKVFLDLAVVRAHPWEYGENLLKLARNESLRSRVTFLEAVSPDDMPALYRDHNVLVFPSTGPEGLPVSILEAMACGLAVVATATGGTTEIIEDGVNGLLCGPDDADGLARLLRTLRHDTELRRRLGARARATIAERFNASRIAAETERYLESAMRRFQDRAAGAAA